MPLEIERKFLLDRFTPPPAAVAEPIEQGYIAITPDGTEVRLRSIAGKYVLGVKRGTGSLSRIEVECPLTESEFDELWPATAGARLVKTRYTVPLEGTTVYVDVYAEGLAGLHTAEVEFASEAAAEDFTPPPWFGSEVTRAKPYKNRILATEGLPRFPAGH
ncbi:adenylate cyclase [Streptomyces sp. NBC_01408]|uniref:adenylate cyclase n=1 Tax=Streptomyces sp. NBC_01408 TaxID=2903855 RepID=UPI00225A5560|nr:adenylate cyclase [Streptomyces sp. NBC_01408]MCX4692841.1 adenylate cyclase [Streptomyces sp. NBC_01408]